MSRSRFFRKVFDGDEGTRQIQSNIEQAIAGAIKSELLDGRQVDSVALVSGSNVIEHKLNRKIRGYIIVKKSANVGVYDVSDDTKFLTLNSSGTATVSLWIY